MLPGAVPVGLFIYHAATLRLFTLATRMRAILADVTGQGDLGRAGGAGVVVWGLKISYRRCG